MWLKQGIETPNTSMQLRSREGEKKISMLQIAERNGAGISRLKQATANSFKSLYRTMGPRYFQPILNKCPRLVGRR